MIDGRDIDGVPTKPPTEEVHEDDAHTLTGSFHRLRRGAGPAVARDVPPEPRDYRDLLARASPAVGAEDRACLHTDTRTVTERGGRGALGVCSSVPEGAGRGHRGPKARGDGPRMRGATGFVQVPDLFG